MGVLDLIKWNVWKIKCLDAAIALELEGQFQPDPGMEDAAVPTLSGTATAGSARPAVQWVAGGRRSVRFRSSFVSAHQLDDIGPKLETLTKLDLLDASLGRAPRLSLQWGDLEIEGFAIVRKRIEGWWAISGWPRRIDFEIEIVEAFPLDLDGTGSSSSGETQFITLAAGEWLETLAARHLGDALRGELVRRINPRIALEEQPGDRVKVYERSHPAMRGAIRPTSPPFLGLAATGDVAELLEAMAADRGTVSRGLAWDRLPEVIAGEVG